MSKARFIFRAFLPELPEFPLPADVVEQAQAHPGPMPTSLNELVDLLQAERQATPTA